MTIGLDARVISTPEITGVGACVLQLVQFLQRQDVDLVLFTDQPAKSLSRFVSPRTTIASQLAWHRYWWESRTLPRLLRQHPVDLYHATWNTGTPIMSGRTVTTVYDIIPTILPQLYQRTIPQKISYALYRRAQRQALERSTQVITISQTSRRDIEHSYPDVSRPITVIPLAANPISAPPAEEAPTSDLIYFGGFEVRKNVAALLRVFQQLRRSRPHLTLSLVGQPNAFFRNQLAAAAASPGVTCTGYLSPEQLTQQLTHARIAVYPSLYEGFGLPVLEAMQHGVPVITSNTSALAELGHGAAVLVDPNNETELGDAITRLLDQPAERERLRRAGQHRAAEYSWERYVQAIWDIYRHL